MRDFTVIAHRGASGYLPEHTLESVAMAHAMGVDYIEQDVVLTRDGVLIVLHDLYLEAVSNVADLYAGRQRPDGHFYAIDFDWDEIRCLKVHERRKPDGSLAFPGRFSNNAATFRIPTLDEEIALIQGLNRSSGRNVGLYIEPKSPAWHRQQGMDLLEALLAALSNHGYTEKSDKVFLQSFDPDLLKRVRFESDTQLRLVQLIGQNEWAESSADFNHLRTERGLSEISAYADGIGPWIPHTIEIKGYSPPDISGFVLNAQTQGLFVHAYTLRADQLPGGIENIGQAVASLTRQAGIDGVFTDHPDQVIRFLESQK